MKLIFLMVLIIASVYAQKILLINSSGEVQKYKTIENAFKKSFKAQYNSIDLKNMSRDEVEEYLYDEYPDIIYTIGTKAYTYASRFLPEKKIFFSSIINYKRLNLSGNRFGVSNELHPGMQITLIHALLPEVKKLSLIYSNYTLDLYHHYKSIAKEFDIKIVGQNFSENNKINREELNKSDGLIIIADPKLLKYTKEVKRIFSNMRELNKPVIAYSEIFIQYGATLAISVDNPTVARQVAGMITSVIEKEKIKNVQMPVGTNIVFNKKVAEGLGITYNKANLSLVNKVIE